MCAARPAFDDKEGVAHHVIVEVKAPGKHNFWLLVCLRGVADGLLDGCARAQQSSPIERGHGAGDFDGVVAALLALVVNAPTGPNAVHEVVKVRVQQACVCDRLALLCACWHLQLVMLSGIGAKCCLRGWPP